LSRIDLSGLEQQLPPEFSTREAANFIGLSYKSPEKTLENWVKKGTLIRLKRGLYAFSENFQKIPAAGSIHGPSYVSYETALSVYEMIPERVETVMSVVDGRPKTQKTPVCLYEYYSQSRLLYSAGISSRTELDRSYLIASKEKALLDTLERRKFKSQEIKQGMLIEFVIDGLRVDESLLRKLSTKKLLHISGFYRNLAPKNFVHELVNLKKIKG
jgi:predicted transcriptional regulator of viral defense system